MKAKDSAIISTIAVTAGTALLLASDMALDFLLRFEWFRENALNVLFPVVLWVIFFLWFWLAKKEQR